MSILAEMRHRKVFRVGAAYAVAAWGLAQIADLVLANTSAPGWVMQVILLVLALGFPVALILAWAFELTPEGVRRTESANAAQAKGRLTTGDAVLVILMLAVIAIAGYQVATMPGETMSAAGSGVTETAGRENTTAAAAPATPHGSTSIAVLAFENMSPDPDNAFFAEGVSEEILNVLASVKDLRVASRTSAFSFTGKQTPIPEIAAQLGVAHVLEGSVRKAGNRVRITAQLIEARTDQHLWSDAYDRDLTDIFAVQEEIAQAITTALKDELGIREVRVHAATDNLEAYQSFLRGRQTFYARGTTLDSAIADLRRAVELDPDFGAAWAVLAAAYYVAPGYLTEIDDDEAYRSGRAAMAKALEFDPDNALAVSVQSLFKEVDKDWVSAIEFGERATRLTTQDSTPALWNAISLLKAGYVAEAHEAALEAWEADPLVGVNNGVLAITALSIGDRTAVERHAEFAARNGWPLALHLLAADACAGGDIEKTLARVEQWLERFNVPTEVVNEALALIDRAGCPAAQSFDEQHSNLDLAALLFMVLGQPDPYFERLRRVSDTSLTGHRSWLRDMWQPASRRFREHPAFFEIADEIGLVELWQTRGYPPGCRPVDGPDDRHLDCSEFPR